MSENNGPFDCDVAVIGGGSGGYAAARTAAGAGLRTVVIDGARELGGLCILRGCMPTKALLYAAEVRHLARAAGTWGMRAASPSFDWTAVVARKDRLIREFADYRVQQLENGPFRLIRSQASFLDPHTVALSTGGTLSAGHFIISTGSTVAEPPLPALSKAGYITSDDALALPKLPRSLIVLGGGAVAVELAQFFARFDVEVIVVQRSPHLVKEFDPDAAVALETALRREGIRLYTGTRLVDAGSGPGGKFVSFIQDGVPTEVRAEEILHALGRVPNTAGLALDRAGVITDGGRIVANGQQQTSVPHIYAAGDCTGPYEVVHIAIQQGEIAAHNVARPATPRTLDYRLLISVVFTEPQLATVGLTETEAQRRGVPFMAARYPFNDHGKSLIMEARDGFVKLLADPATGEILGGCCAGPSGGDLIHEIVAAMAKHMTVHELAAMPHYHPTLAEIWTYPAEELASR